LGFLFPHSSLYPSIQRQKVVCYFRDLSGDEAKNIKKQIDINVRHIRHRTRPSIQQRRSNQRRSVEFVHGVISGQMGLHTAPGRSVKRGAHPDHFW
jgi:peptide subunit release factor 1 (eRF1)